MKANPVLYCTLIIRSQSEYSVATQTVITRCIIELPGTDQRRGFTDIESLLAALRVELMECKKIIPGDQEVNKV